MFYEMKNHFSIQLFSDEFSPLFFEGSDFKSFGY